MRRRIGLTGAFLMIAALFWATAKAQSADETAKMEPAAVDALKEMGTYLRSLKDFQVHAESTLELVMDDGQKVQLDKNTDLLARLPDRLMAKMDGDQGQTMYLYNGKVFTIYAHDQGFYSTVAAPSTLFEGVNILGEKYNIEIPLVDLFLWGREGVDSPKITSAIDIGASDVGGVTCEHYIYRQEGLDWQVWIQRGSHPVPRKMVLTTTTDDARPQHTSVLTWNLLPSYDESTFTFIAPADAHEIPFASAMPKVTK